MSGAGVHAGAAACALLLLAGCTSTVAVNPERPLPRPLVVPLPATVGLVLDDALRGFRQDETRGGVNWRVQLGTGHERLLREVFGATFRDVLVFGSVPEARAQPGLDAIFAPAIEQYSFATERDTGGYWAVTLRYRMTLLTPDAQPVDTLALSGYGSAPDDGGSGRSLERATLAAMRDAAAKFIVQFPQQPLAARLRGDQPVEARQASASGPVEDMEMLPIEPDG